MMNIYLCEEEKDAKLLRNLMRIQTSCVLVQNYYRLPNVTTEVKDSAKNINDYCKKAIANKLKTCKKVAKMSEAEVDLMHQYFESSLIMEKCLGSCCVIAGKEAELVSMDLKKINICEKLQKALESGQNVILW